MSVHNTINVSKVIYKCRAPILLLPVSNLSSILTLSTFTSLGMYNNASPFKSFLDHCCSVPLLSTPQSRKKIVPIGMPLVECGRFREWLGNYPGRPK